MEKKIGGTEHGSNKGARSPSPKIEEEIDEQIEQHGANLKTALYCIKIPREYEKVGPQKKFKASKTSLDPITLTEGYLNDVGDTV